MERIMPSSINNNTGPIRALFARMDRNEDGGIDRKEVKKHLEDVGAPAGLFGIYHSTASDKFVSKLDTNKDDKVTWNEFQGTAQQMLPASMRNAAGNVDPTLADPAFTSVDTNGDGGVSGKELEAAALAALPADASFRGVTAEIAAKLGLDALDTNQDGTVSAAEMKAAASEAAELLNDRSLQARDTVEAEALDSTDRDDEVS
jgi:Ca2+-binding EF-hand superfamily protein